MAADQDVYFDAEVSTFYLHDGSQLRELTSYINSMRGLPGQFKVNDITTYGSVGERPGPSIFVVHFSIELLFNMVTDVGVHTVLNGMWSNKALRAYEYYPAGETVGNPKFSGNAYLPVYEIEGRVGNYLTVHADLYGDNGVSIGVKA